MIGLKISHQFFNQREVNPKPIVLCTCDFSRALSKLQVISRNSDWFIALFAAIVIGRSNNFGVDFCLFFNSHLKTVLSCNDGDKANFTFTRISAKPQ